VRAAETKEKGYQNKGKTRCFGRAAEGLEKNGVAGLRARRGTIKEQRLVKTVFFSKGQNRDSEKRSGEGEK